MTTSDRVAILGQVTCHDVNPHGEPGPFVCMSRLFDDGATVQDWYTRDEALDVAARLRDAALSLPEVTS